MSLGYYSQTISGDGTKPDARYSGDISSWTWTHGNGNSAVVRSYGFTYDGAHRLTDARYYAGTTAGSITNKLSERAISYDRAGNITALSAPCPTRPSQTALSTPKPLSMTPSATFAHAPAEDRPPGTSSSRMPSSTPPSPATMTSTTGTVSPTGPYMTG